MRMRKRYKYGISTTVDYSVEIIGQIEIISKCGFDFISLGARIGHCHFLHDNMFAKMLEIAAKNGLKINSIHFPFGAEYDIASRDENKRRSAIDFLKEFCERSLKFGISIIILHPHHYFDDSKESCLERSILSLEEILKFKSADLHIAIENLPGKESSWIFGQLMDKFDPQSFGFCYDSSHENISGPPWHLLGKYLSRLTTCHLSDNHGLSDEHLLPGDGNIDWRQLRHYFDSADNLTNILFEVGTGDKLAEPLEIFARKAWGRADKYFG